jgi:hypothetical protein
MKKSKLSALFSLIYPGLGHFYLGHYIDGIIIGLVTSFLWAIIYKKGMYLTLNSGPKTFAIFIGLLILYFYSIADAYLKSRKKQKQGFPPIVVFIAGVSIWVVFWPVVGRNIVAQYEQYFRRANNLQEYKQTHLTQPLKDKVNFNLKTYVIPGGSCKLDNAMGLAAFLEPQVNLNTFIFYSEPTLFVSGRGNCERYGTGGSDIIAFQNLGYRVYRGTTIETVPPCGVYPTIPPEDNFYFQNYEKAFYFLKQLLSNGIVPIVNVSREPLGLKTSGGDFVILSGFSPEGVWLNEPTQELADKQSKQVNDPFGQVLKHGPRLVSYQTFEDAWSGQFFWHEKVSEPISFQQMFTKNATAAQETPEKIDQIIDFLQTASGTRDYTSETNIAAYVGLSRTLDEKDHTELAQVYKELALLEFNFDTDPPGIFHVDDIIRLLSKEKPLFEKAAKLWSSYD